MGCDIVSLFPSGGAVQQGRWGRGGVPLPALHLGGGGGGGRHHGRDHLHPHRPQAPASHRGSSLAAVLLQNYS